MSRPRIVRRELGSLRREKTIVLALAIQLFIAGFSSFLLVGLVSLYDPGSVSGGGIQVGVSGNASADLVEGIDGEGEWRLRRFEDRAAAREAFGRGRVDALFHATERPSGVVRVEAVVPEGTVRSTVIVVQVRSALQGYERVRREALADRLTRQPVPLPEAPDTTPTFAFTYTVLIPLLVFLPTFISGSIASDTITEELDAGTLDLLRVTPLSTRAIVDGKMAAAIGIAPLQAAAWLGLLWLNGTAIANPLPILALVTAAATLLVAFGAGLAVRFGERQSAQLVYSLSVLTAFAATVLLPQSPANAVARLAIGSATPVSYAVALGALPVAGVAYWGARELAAGELVD